jgi:hypothetical protein
VLACPYCGTVPIITKHPEPSWLCRHGLHFWRGNSVPCDGTTGIYYDSSVRECRVCHLQQARGEYSRFGQGDRVIGGKWIPVGLHTYGCYAKPSAKPGKMQQPG